MEVFLVKWFVVSALVLLVSSGQEAFAQEEQDVEVQTTRVVTVGDAKVHRGPSPNAPVITRVQSGTRFTVIGHSYGWMRVAGDGEAIGWISRELLGRPAAPREEFGVGVFSMRAEAAGPCVDDFDSCSTTGCGKTSGDKAINQRKRHQVTVEGALQLSFDDFLALQMHCLKDDDPVGEGATPTPRDRETKLRALSLRGGRRAGEGDSVMLSGFLVGKPHATGGESVNCGFSHAGETDFHINVAPSPRSSEHQSIVVEMIPQKRPESWTTRKLLAATRQAIPVFVSGQLFYDSKHFVNARPGLKGREKQPKRFSLWEIHPIRGFLVCPSRDCDMNNPKSAGWTKLAAWTP
ncbi:MAG: SH3 domain-containing protein [Thermoanaerobaculia bacterium]